MQLNGVFCQSPRGPPKASAGSAATAARQVSSGIMRAGAFANEHHKITDVSKLAHGSMPVIWEDNCSAKHKPNCWKMSLQHCRQSLCPQTSAAFSFTSCTGSAISGVQGSAGIQKQPPTQVLGLRSRRNNWMYNSSYIYLDYLASLTCTQTLYTQVFVKQLPQSRQEFVLAGRPTSWSASLKCCTRGVA